MHNSLHCRDFRLCFPSPMSLIVESILVKKFEYHLGRISSSRAQLVAQVSGSTQVQVSGSTHPARADGTIYIAAAPSAAPSSRPVRRFTHQPRPQPCAAPSAAPRSSPVRRPEQPPRPPLHAPASSAAPRSPVRRPAQQPRPQPRSPGPPDRRSPHPARLAPHSLPASIASPGPPRSPPAARLRGPGAADEAGA